MKKNGVSWKEGMFLLPQHFQRQDLFFENQLGLSAAIDQPFAYGFQKLVIDEAALENWEIVVNQATGRTRTGSLFEFLEGETVRLDLNSPRHEAAKEALETGRELLVFLAIAVPRPNNANVSNENEHARYEEYSEDVYDLHSGGDEKRLVFKKLRGFLTATDDLGSDFEYLPIGRFSLASSMTGDFPGVVRSFIPPSTACLASQSSRQFFQDMESRLTAYLRTVVDYLQATGINILRLTEQEDCETVYRYMQFSELRSWFVTNQQSKLGAHPFEAFRTLSQFIGRLAITDPDLEPDGLIGHANYNHDDAFDALDWAWKRITGNFVPPGDSRVKRLPFLAENMATEQSDDDIVMKCVIPPECFESNWTLYLGFDFEFGKMTSEDAKQFLKYMLNPKEFYWKLGSIEKVNSYFKNVDRGVWFDKNNISRKKPGLPRKDKLVYVEVDDDEYWNAVKRSGLLCLRIDQKNLKTPQRDLGTEKITVVVNRRTYVYRASVYAVRNQD